MTICVQNIYLCNHINPLNLLSGFRRFSFSSDSFMITNYIVYTNINVLDSSIREYKKTPNINFKNQIFLCLKSS